MNKNTNWITIPENKIHTPVSNVSTPKKGTNQNIQSVQNKIFWGVGFVALVIMAFSALAPAEFNAIIKGDLFDAQGGPEALGLSSLVPSEKQGSTPFDTDQKVDDNMASTAEKTSSDSSKSQNVNTVQPESEAVNIAVKPIAPHACGTDLDCFIARLSDCGLATADFSYQLNNQPARLALEIKGAEQNNCKFEVGFAEGPDASVEGSFANCLIEKSSTHTPASLEANLADQGWFASQCTGQAAGLIANYFDQQATQEATDAQNLLIEELTAKLNALEEQQAQDQQVISDLKNNTVRPSAPENTLPSSITSTTAIGQPPAQIPGFRANPYVVNVTPQQILQQNLSGGVQLAQGNVVNAYHSPVQTYTGSSAIQNQPLSGGTTPESGPAEMMLLAVLITYMGYLSLRFVKRFRV